LTGILLPRRDFTLARWLFARVLGAVFFCAFASLAVQIRGLAGAHGIVPAGPWLDAVMRHEGPSALWQVPTLCWIDASDTMLVTLCVVGVLISLLLTWGECFPGACTLVLWGLYLSLCWVSNPFLGFQWDALLLETALLGAALLPWRWKPDWGRTSIPSEAARWLLWWLLFRLMFESGVVKLASHDHTWRGLTALDYHFETQPLPPWTAWFAHQTPEPLLCLSTAVMFVIEFVGPLLIFAPRRWRHGGAWALIALQLLIIVTGNYAFFNYLTIGLCLLLFDNAAWPARWHAWFEARWPEAKPNNPPPLPPVARPRWIAAGVMALVFLVTVQPLVSSLGRLFELEDFDRVHNWPPFSWLRDATAPTMSFNGYGLFAVMTTSRHEIEVEGSDDGVSWRTYSFSWKPGDIHRRPGFVAPHQPRLDWQMWFAALGEVQQNPWFVNFLVRLLEGSPEVLGLLENNPFPNGPPRYVRASLYDYHFTRSGDGKTGWWKREPLGLYCPMITLEDGKPVVVPPAPAAKSNEPER